MHQNSIKNKGKNAFDTYYENSYKERWVALKEALLKEKTEHYEIKGLLTPYYLDEISYRVASSLPVKEGDTLLDMCAAPGGKSLSLALRLNGSGSLTLNDISPERRRRLKSVINSSLPEEKRHNITFTSFNAESWGVYEKGKYDAILLDAPCSSEEHVLKSDKHLLEWSPTRPKRLSLSQFSMLSSALIALKSGGYIMYSTCSINPKENEEVIKKLFQRHSGEIIEVPFDIENKEKREYGGIVLPDKSGGKGPMYSCLLKKI